MTATHRQAKKRTLQRAGFVYVAGWVPEKSAPAIEREIEKARADVAAQLDEAT